MPVWGNTTYRVGQLSEDEFALSQVLIAIDVQHISPDASTLIDETIADIKASERIDGGAEILYPGEKEYLTRLDNLEKGIPVNDEIWVKILNS